MNVDIDVRGYVHAERMANTPLEDIYGEQIANAQEAIRLAKEEAEAAIEAIMQGNLKSKTDQINKLNNRINVLRERFFTSSDIIFPSALRRLFPDVNGELLLLRTSDTENKIGLCNPMIIDKKLNK